ncbi:acyltransferase family protein [Roseburia sp. 1XD42-69]|uniref:acyltransferase family protein n=1 Tax=Roseburia sp. 1XD42-69 TaxID=2320088 RepID=UPI000EA15F41|nr:acyltransferase [Roseburia sp. 1XD42-69]RKJ68102.1 acyltransferase [Roseburia sp. 1XD42-69]
MCNNSNSISSPRTNIQCGGGVFFGGKFYFGYLVELFFLISGYFTFNYIQKIKDGLTFKSFYLHRAFRLLPLVSIAAVVFEVILYFYANVYKFSWFDVKASLWGMILDCLGIQAGWSSINPCVNNPTWYISVLLICYLLFYFITYWSHRLKVSPYYGYVFMIFVGIGILTYGISIPGFTYETARGYYAFFFGIVFHKFLSSEFMKEIRNVLGFAIFLFITFLMIFQWDIVSVDINYLFTFVYYPSILIILKNRHIANVFKGKFWGILAGISFNVYIWHSVLHLATVSIRDILGVKINMDGGMPMLYFTLFCFLWGTISFNLIEKPIKEQLKRKGL